MLDKKGKFKVVFTDSHLFKPQEELEALKGLD